MDNNTSAKQRKGGATTWLLLGGVFVILLAVLGVTTHDRLQRSGELMEQSLTQHGVLVVRSLEGATRAGMRRGMWRLNLLQALAEEMADQPHVHSITIIGHNGDILAAAGRGKAMGSVNQPDPMAELPLEAATLVKSFQPLTHFAHNELVVGRPFEPLRRYVARRGILPPWACALDNTTPQPRRPPPPQRPGNDAPSHTRHAAPSRRSGSQDQRRAGQGLCPGTHVHRFVPRSALGRP